MAASAVSRLPPLPTIGEILKIYKLKARKNLSQNFILDGNLLRRIVRAAGDLTNAHVCEVGPGPGGITRAILNACVEHLDVIEKDRRFLPTLEAIGEASGGRLSIHHADVLRFNMSNLFPSTKASKWTADPPNIHIIGNLPFNVSTPLIVQWLNSISQRSDAWKYGRVQMTLTFQKEVAERMIAPILNDQRCRLSVMCQYLCDVRHVFTIPGRLFVPEPDVDVGVVHFTPHVQPKINAPFEYVEKLLRHVFHYRQKKCKHGLTTLFPPDQNDLTNLLLTAADVPPESKSYELTMEEIARLCETYRDICIKHPGLLKYDYRSPENAPSWRTASKKCISHSAKQMN